eukprot:NODE_31_length_37178_cov_0.413576.p2 type:complete len:873 gc:universal NODE_31_length_37178_cov_0.413576:16373-13755(-)
MLIPTCFAATYLLQVNSMSEVDGLTQNQVLKSQEDLLAKLRQQGLKVKKTGSSTYLTNVIQVEIPDDQRAQVSKAEGVAKLVKSVTFPKPRVLKQPGTSKKPLVNSAHELTGVNEVRQEFGLTGRSIRIGIVDTGIDYTHSAFANEDGKSCLGPGCRVIIGYDFTEQNDFNDCMDTAGGHGTHVSGIVGGKNGNLTGVAPNVVFGGYKVFGANDGASDFHILEALAQTAKDKMDVVNLSLGSSSGWDHGILEEALEELHKKNIIVVAANGNDGRDGLYMSGSPAIAKNTLAVASMDNKPLVSLREFVLDGKTYPYQFTKAGGNSQTPPLPVKNAGKLCAPLTGFPAKTIGAVSVGDCDLDTKIINAYKSGIPVVFMINDKDQYFTAFTSYDYPVLYLQKSVGALFSDEIKTITFTDKSDTLRIEGGGDPSFFTSWGLGSELQIKPEIGAPGHQIFSSIPKSECGGQDCYAVWSGTSMATPYIVGCAALYLEKFKDPKDFKSRIMTTAVPAKQQDIFSVAQQGGGMVNMMNLIKNTMTVNPSKLTLGADKSKSWVKQTTVSISSTAKETKQFTCSHEDAIAVRGTQHGEVFTQQVTNSVDVPKQVTVVPGKATTIKVKITPDASLKDEEHWIFSGYVKCVSDGEVISIPFGGFKGDYLSIDPFPEYDEQLPLPLIIDSMQKGSMFHKPEESFTTKFNDQTGEIPILVARFVHPVEALQIQVIDKATNKAIGITHYQKHVGRHSGQFNQQDPWSYMYPFVLATELENGAYCVGCVATDKSLKKWQEIPNGSYYLKLTAQKAMGDVYQKNHYVEWTSPTMVVTRKQKKQRGRGSNMKSQMKKVQDIKKLIKTAENGDAIVKKVEGMTFDASMLSQ